MFAFTIPSPFLKQMHLEAYSTPNVGLGSSNLKFLVYRLKNDVLPTDASPHMITFFEKFTFVEKIVLFSFLHLKDMIIKFDN